MRRSSRGIVHGDLSVDNLMWWDDTVVVIDVLQAVDAVTNPKGADPLYRDIENAATGFGRQGVPIDPERLIAELLTDLI